jgi:hypothetical protein
MKMWLPTVPVPEEAARALDPSFVPDVPYRYPYPSGHMLRAVLLFGGVYLLWPNRLLRAAIREEIRARSKSASAPTTSVRRGSTAPVR